LPRGIYSCTHTDIYPPTSPHRFNLRRKYTRSHCDFSHIDPFLLERLSSNRHTHSHIHTHTTPQQPFPACQATWTKATVDSTVPQVPVLYPLRDGYPP
jgi:hypothetical protein